MELACPVEGLSPFETAMAIFRLDGAPQKMIVRKKTIAVEETDLIAAVKRLKNGIIDECACGDALFAMTPAGKLNKLRREREEKKLKQQIDASLSRHDVADMIADSMKIDS